MISRLFLIGALAFVFGGSSCKKEATSNRYELLLPSNFPAPEYNLASNPVTPEGFELGKRLFYDPLLSQDSTISCADCHISFSAFSHPDHITSHGIRGQFGKRNAPAIQNLIWQRAFFWDGCFPEDAHRSKFHPRRAFSTKLIHFFRNLTSTEGFICRICRINPSLSSGEIITAPFLP